MKRARKAGRERGRHVASTAIQPARHLEEIGGLKVLRVGDAEASSGIARGFDVLPLRVQRPPERTSTHGQVAVQMWQRA
jgi:hypothetical protein